MTFLETIEQNRQNFLNFNRKKLERFQALIANADVKKVINAIPFLLSINDSKLPGYVDGDVPIGIANYMPNTETAKFIESRFHLSNFALASESSFIEMLAVMGSPGTIAYTKKSDCDYWCCVNKQNATKEQLENLQKKIDDIQNWVMKEADMEVHLFMNDIDSLKKNIYAEDEDEAFGSTIGATLKDEFYRSSIIIAGKTPFWWVAPHVSNEKYEALYAQIPNDVLAHYIDLGNMFAIPKEDFMGAALFQLVKSLGNPFKSILKIGVLEKYLFGPPIPHLLCHKIKDSIHKGEFHNEILDSYILMFEAVYEYYGVSLNDKTLINILPKNLYLKINPQLSRYETVQKKNLPYKVVVMSRYAAQWKWTKKEIEDLDNFDNWDYTKIMIFWNSVKKFMLLSYQKIANELPNLNLQQKISATDYALLSHKIKANFLPDENAIDIYITFKDAPYEAIIYIEPVKLGSKDSEWRVYKRNIASPGQTTTLKTKNDLVKLSAWIALNNIYDPVFSRVQLQSGYTKIDQSVIQNLLTDMFNLFNRKKIHSKNDFFLRPAFTTKTMLIVNFNEKDSDFINSIYYLYKNSWGQAYMYQYNDPGVLTEIIKTMLTDSLKLKLPYEESCAINIPNPFKKNYKLLDRFFREAYSAIVSDSVKSSIRFIGKLDNDFICVTREKKDVTVTKQANILALLSSLTISPKLRIEYHFLSDEPQLVFLKEILGKWRRNMMSIVYENKGPYTFIYVLNEGGNIFSYIVKSEFKNAALATLCRFSIETIQHVNKESLVLSLQNEIELIRLSQEKDGKISFFKDTGFLKDIYQKRAALGEPFSAVIAKDEENRQLYSIQALSGFKTPFVPINSLANVIQTLPKNGVSIPFVAEIKFNNLNKNELLLGSGTYLMEKARIDFMLSKHITGAKA
ncbi:MAG: class I adenylate cyclase [Spirochaetia bacterium]|jgi:adenylate cyclase class 1|nr:class I adenylate cyclase [Spirochaetia bacterium]